MEQQPLLTSDEVDEILSTDKISEDDSGFYMIPGRRVHIHSDMVRNEDDSDLVGDRDRNLEWNKAHLFAFVDNGDFTYSSHTGEKYYCSNFYVKFEHEVWMRNFFDDALDVIEALKIKNGFVDPW